MKILFSIIALLCLNMVSAQQVLSTISLAGDPTNDDNFINNGNYAIDTNNERDQYVGLWRYTGTYDGNSIVFDLKIEKRDKARSSMVDSNGDLFHYSFADEIVFKYKLTRNGVVVHDNLNQVISVSENYYSNALKYGADSSCDGIFVDYGKYVHTGVSVTRLNTTPAKIYFDLNSSDYMLKKPREYYRNAPGKLFSIPTDGIEMVKVQ